MLAFQTILEEISFSYADFHPDLLIIQSNEAPSPTTKNFNHLANQNEHKKTVNIKFDLFLSKEKNEKKTDLTFKKKEDKPTIVKAEKMKKSQNQENTIRIKEFDLDLKDD